MTNTLYLKYRPQKFIDLIAQDHISKVLRSQVELKDFSHAYIFTGPRGCGKTSTARIFAKAINCLNSENGEACENCANCRIINENKAVDIIEIDAASNRTIDDIRSLRESVKFHPISLSYKVFIIDEVHMLGKEAFNALLKTLEEPPEYVIFILCTTDLHKVPITILSRCQQFHFRLAKFEELEAKLKSICESENIEIDQRSLETIIDSAQGSFRDAESLLQKLFSNNSARSDSKISYEETLKILQLPDKTKVVNFFENFFKTDFDLKLNELENILSIFQIEQFVSVAIKTFRESQVYAFDQNLKFKIYELLLELKSKIKISQNTKDWLEVYLWKIYNLQNKESFESKSQEVRFDNIDSKNLIANDSQLNNSPDNLQETNTHENKIDLEKDKSGIGGVSNDVKTNSLSFESSKEIAEIKSENESVKINSGEIGSIINSISLIIKEDDARLANYLLGAKLISFEKGKLTLAVKSKLAKSVLEIKKNFDKIVSLLESKIGSEINLEIVIIEDEKKEKVVDPIEVFGAMIA